MRRHCEERDCDIICHDCNEVIAEEETHVVTLDGTTFHPDVDCAGVVLEQEHFRHTPDGNEVLVNHESRRFRR